MKSTVYIETTIISYLTAWPSRDVIRLSHEMLTRDWWAKHRHSFELYASDFVIEEASRGDPAAAAKRIEALANVPLLPINQSTTELAQRLAVSLALPSRARLDAAHVAISAVYGMTFLLTWNCTHLANGVLADKIDRTCLEAGFRAPRILTPELLMESP
jgi:hypothetical protein